MTYGAAPYSAAPYSASNATPAPDAGAGVGLVALGFRTLTLGTPAVPQAAAGFSGTGFGAPSGLSAFRAGSIVPQTALGAAAATVSTPKVASGFEAVAFGQPSTALGAIGFQSGQPGVASASVRFRAAALAPGTQIPTPYTPQVATGFSAAVLGQPFVLKYLPPVLDQLGQAFGFAATALGRPDAGWLQTGAAAGFAGALLGRPASGTGHQAAGFTAFAWGTGQAHWRARAGGFALAALGLPAVRLTQAAAHGGRATRFGLPAAVRSRTYLAYGINRAGRIGQPAGAVRINRTAAGFCSAALGTVSAQERSRALHLAPTTRFGKPLLLRAPTC